MLHYDSYIRQRRSIRWSFFIANGKEVKTYFMAQKLVQKYGLPEGSDVFINESIYTDDVTWEKVVAVLAPGIRKMPVTL